MITKGADPDKQMEQRAAAESDPMKPQTEPSKILMVCRIQLRSIAFRAIARSNRKTNPSGYHKRRKTRTAHRPRTTPFLGSLETHKVWISPTSTRLVSKTFSKKPMRKSLASKKSTSNSEMKERKKRPIRRTSSSRSAESSEKRTCTRKE